MFVILTSKPGQFRTEGGPGLTPVQAWEYRFAGRLRARFVIARIEGQPRITLVDDEPPQAVNHIPAKFLPRFESIEAAALEIAQLARFGGDQARLDEAPL